MTDGDRTGDRGTEPASDGERAGRTATRRAVLAAATGLAGAAGCLGASPTVDVLAAGSLQRALGTSLDAMTQPTVRVEAYGSARCARLVASGQRDPDVLVLADGRLFESIVESPWYALFASNALVLAYGGERGARIGEAERWFDPLVDGGVDLGRTDPELDPLGYRTLFALELAATHYDRPDLPERVLDPRQVYPETELMAQFETGGIDAAFVYRNMAVEHGYDFRSLPTAVDLSSPSMGDRYAVASYTLPGGSEVRGSPIAYGATLRHRTDATERVFERLLFETDRYLASHGFVNRAAYPEFRGEPPDGLAN